MIELNLSQAKKLLEYFGGEDADVTVEHFTEGHSGRGLYCWCSDYPEDGCEFLGMTDADQIAIEYQTDEMKGREAVTQPPKGLSDD